MSEASTPPPSNARPDEVTGSVPAMIDPVIAACRALLARHSVVEAKIQRQINDHQRVPFSDFTELNATNRFNPTCLKARAKEQARDRP